MIVLDKCTLGVSYLKFTVVEMPLAILRREVQLQTSHLLVQVHRILKNNEQPFHLPLSPGIHFILTSICFIDEL